VFLFNLFFYCFQSMSSLNQPMGTVGIVYCFVVMSFLERGKGFSGVYLLPIPSRRFFCISFLSSGV